MPVRNVLANRRTRGCVYERPSDMLTWLLVLSGMGFLAWLWFAYLVRIVLNDEVVQERRRRRMRARELERRTAEDKAARRRL